MTNTAEIAAQLGRVATSTLTTVMMKAHGLYNTSIRDVFPCNPNACRFAGPATTVRYLPLREDLVATQMLDHEDNLMRPAIEAMAPRSVMVLDANQRNDVGILGGNLVVRMKVLGAAGAITDGGMRDIPELMGIDFPVYATASAPPPSFTKLMIVDVGQPVSCGGVPVFPGDFVVADEEGAAVVPAGIAEAVAEAGQAMDEIEDYVHRRLRTGARLAGTYPPDEKMRADFEAWKADGKPDF